MKKKLQRIAFALVLMFINIGLYAQGYVKGIVTDGMTNETLIGASVYIKGTTTGATTDEKGAFKFDAPTGSKTIVVQYIGYIPIEVEVAVKSGQTSDMGTIQLAVNQVGLKEVIILASVAVSRKTPVAISTLEPKMIEERLGTMEFPEILKSTPGVYATKQGGGYGDSRINLRGFESSNTAVMINGVPVNDMEWGGVYWSNWAGLADVTRSMQVQRGLGASKVSAPSLGGSINILTNTTDAKRGGAISYGVGNNGYNKIGFSVSTGLTDKNWAITLLGAKTSGQGYVQGTEFESYSYFVNVSKKLNASHSFSFTAFGAPQWHNQRNNGDKLTIAEWQKQPNKYLYNASYGFDMNGQRKVSSLNVYNKPQLSLNHFWTISSKTSLSSVIYASIGDGYGTSGQGATSTDRGYWYGSTLGVPNTTFRTLDGTFDYGAVYAYNKVSLTGSKMAMSKSVNSHRWYGALSTFTTKIKNIDFYGGIDLRYYKGTHTNVLTDLYGGNFFIDATSTRPLLSDQSWKTRKLGVGDVVYRDYDGFVFSQGVFMQAEYNKDALSTFISLSGSNTTQWRYDRFYYDADQAKSKTFNALGYCAKGGANYNLTDKHNVFANIGIISRAPYFSGGAFLQSTTSNAINPNAINEKAFSAELGYGFRSKYLAANLNVYNTKWINKTIVRGGPLAQADPLIPAKIVSVNMEGVDALHQGVELDLSSKPIKNLEIKGMVSIGNWNWISNATGYLYTDNGQPSDINGNPVEFGSPEHIKMNVNLKDIHVGNSAQTTVALGFKFEMLKNFNIGLDGNYYGRNYSNFSISPSGSGYGDLNFSQPWMIPDATVFDLSTSYRFKIGNLDATFIGNIDNLLNVDYITDATTGTNNDWQTSQVFYGFGRTFSASLKIKF